MPETVEYDLYALDVGELNRFQCLFYALHAHTVIAQLAGRHEVIEHSEDLRMVVEICRRAVQLQEIYDIGCQVPKAFVDPARKVLTAIALGSLFRQLPACLGQHHNFFFTFLLQTRNQALAASVAVNICGVDEVDSGIDGGIQGFHGFFVAHLSPSASNGPSSKADLRNIPSRAAQRSILHRASFLLDLWF